MCGQSHFYRPTLVKGNFEAKYTKDFSTGCICYYATHKVAVAPQALREDNDPEAIH